MAGLIAYTLVIAIPVYLAAWLVSPTTGALVVFAATVMSVYRYMKHRGDKQEEGGFWYVAVPAYLFCIAMLVVWF